MNTFGKLVFLPLFFGLVLWAAAAAAGEKGTVSCSTPDCGYHDNLTIGGAKQSPSLTGYCRSTKKFVRVKPKSWDDYRKIIPACPDCPEPPADLRRFPNFPNSLSQLRQSHATL